MARRPAPTKIQLAERVTELEQLLAYTQHRLHEAELRLRCTPGGEAAHAALAALAAKAPAERAVRAWVAGGGAHGAAKASVSAAIAEFGQTGNATECARQIFDLQMPFFAHEAVKQICIAALAAGEGEAGRLAALLRSLASVGVVSRTQLLRGLRRVEEQMDDLALDVPAAPQRFAELKAGLLGLQ